MKSAWVDRDAEALVAHAAKSGIDRDLALRIYTTRLLGRDPKLVLHGGGNTSLKTRMRDLFGEDVEVLRIKASGADMAAIELEGLPAVRLNPLRRLRGFDAIADDEFVRQEGVQHDLDRRSRRPRIDQVGALDADKFVVGDGVEPAQPA